jgi:hypothetical protein
MPVAERSTHAHWGSPLAAATGGRRPASRAALRHRRRLLLWQALHDPAVRKRYNKCSFDIYVASLDSDVYVMLAPTTPPAQRRARVVARARGRRVTAQARSSGDGDDGPGEQPAQPATLNRRAA